MKRFLFLLLLLAALVCVSAVSAEGNVAVTVSPEHPRVGDYVDIQVTPGREAPQNVTYTLLCDEESVFEGKPVEHYAVSFRPRKEGNYTLTVTVSYGKDDSETAGVSLQVSGEAPAQESEDVVYSQKDGWWHKIKYSSKRNLEKAGCAIFALSHALQRIGVSGESVTPEKLARTYAGYYVEGRGTYNEGLISKAAQDYDFLTQKALVQSSREIVASLRRGDLFSFSIVDGHIALADAASADGTRIHIVDSAPGATFERIRLEEKIFFLSEDGTFSPAAVPEDLPGMRWFFETQEYGGMQYWMDTEYCASRGMRVIRMPWLKADLGEGLQRVEPEYAGALITKVTRDRNALRVPTASLSVAGVDPEKLSVVMAVPKKGTQLKDGNGKAIPDKKRLARNYMALLVEPGEDFHYVYWDGTFGYVAAADVTILPAVREPFRTGLIAQNGYTTGGSQVTVHLEPYAKSTGIALWKTGTPVAVVEEKDHFLLVEGKGMRGWIHEKYFKPDEPEKDTPEETSQKGSSENGQKIDEGK
ncbi:MAG: hypothetical protein IKO25_00035 [Clostridia bacterium]|nr:hypothetical protein [Clostridia bacterium]